MEETTNTAVIEQCLLELSQANESAAVDDHIRILLERSVTRLRFLCLTMLYKRYPRLTRAPLQLDSDELLSFIIERLIKAMQSARPVSVRAFYALANQHMRWELNDLARRLDKRTLEYQSLSGGIPAPSVCDTAISDKAIRILTAIEELPDREREVFSLIKIQEMTLREVASTLEVSIKTVQRRLNRSLMILSDQLADMRPTLLNDKGKKAGSKI